MKCARRRAGRLYAIVAALLFAGSASAATYRWTDADGNPQFGDRPPPGVNAETVVIPPPPPMPMEIPAAEPAAGAPSQEALERDAARREQERLTYERERQVACQRARANLQKTQAGQIGVPRPDGRLRLATESEQQQMIARARADVAQYCTPP